jgi:hypothetical protein
MSRHRFPPYSAILIVMLAGAGCLAAQAQSQTDNSAQPTQVNSTQNSQDNQDPLKRQLSDKERFKQQKELKQELSET